MAVSPLQKAQLKAVMALLDHICNSDPSDLMMGFACRLLHESDWQGVTGTVKRQVGPISDLLLSFPLNSSVVGTLQISVWGSNPVEYNLALTCSDKPDFAMERFYLGSVWHYLNDSLAGMSLANAA